MLLTTTGYAPDTHRISNMIDWERPNTKKKLQRFLGIVNFFRRFMPSISEKLQALLEIRDLQFEWTEEMEKAYRFVYKALIEDSPFLWFPIPGVTLELEVDASDSAIGAALF